MSARTRTLALATFATMSAPALSASQTYETVVIAPPSQEVGQANLPMDQLRQAPGAQGDAGKALEDLPGVARPQLGGSELVVWGAAPGETRIAVDGMEIPMLYHMGGLRSVVHSGFASNFSLVPGGYGADHGRGLGGLVRIDSRAPPLDGYQGEVNVDVLDASFAAGAAISNRIGVLGAGRVGYLDRILNDTLSADTRRLFPLPRYHDFQGKVVVGLREGERIEAIVLTSADASAISRYSASPSSVAEQDRRQSFSRFGIRYVRALPDGSGASLTPFVGWDRTDLEQVSGLAMADETIASTVLGLRGDYLALLSPGLTLVLGFDGYLTLTSARRAGSPTLPPREGDIVAFGQPMSGAASTDSWRASIGNLAPYFALEIARGSWRLSPSFRLDGVVIATNRDAPKTASTPQVGTSQLSFAPAPRLALAHRTSAWSSESLAIGLYHQAPDPGDLSAVFGTPTLSVAHALHVVVDTQLTPVPGVTVQPTLFYRTLWNLVARNPDANPPLAQALVQSGVGRAYGAQVLVRLAPASVFSGWLAYTLSRSERRLASAPSARLFDQDQTHVLTVVGSASFAGLVVGARFRLATGMPRTPVVGSYLDATTGQYQPIFGPQNTIRLPAFYALDLRIERRFRRRSLDIVPYLEVLNLTNHANVEEFAYDDQFASRANITGLPILAVAGASLRFR